MEYSKQEQFKDLVEVIGYEKAFMILVDQLQEHTEVVTDLLKDHQSRIKALEEKAGKDYA